MKRLQDVLVVYPDHYPSRLLLAQLMLSQGEAQQARQSLEQALSREPDNEALRIGLAQLEVHQGQHRKALDILEQPSEQIRSAEYRALKAVLLQSQARHMQAAQEYLAALRAQPQNAAWLVGLGISLQAQGNASAAQEAFAQARSTSSFSPQLEAVIRLYSKP